MSVKSMTGYGRASGSLDGKEINIDIKSVNHRYFDFNAKLSKDYIFLEDKLKSKVNEQVTRGKIDLYLFVNGNGESSYEFIINEQLANGYADAFKTLSKKLKIKNDITSSFFTTVPEVIKLKKKEIDEQLLETAVLDVLQKALESYNAMRVSEGKKLQTYIVDNLGLILENVSKIELLTPESIENYKTRLISKIKEALESNEFDEQRVITEVAIFADKIDVGEETSRLRSHISQFGELMNGKQDAVGKKLDFIIQEMNREVNTIGSKCNSIEITRLVVDTKSIIEKIREQIQNIE